MKNEVIFKKALFGGFDRREVISYIAELHEKLSAAEKTASETDRLRAELEEKERILSRLEAEKANSRMSSECSLDELIERMVTFSDDCADGLNSLADSRKYDDDVKEKVMRVATAFSEVSDTITELVRSSENLNEAKKTVEAEDESDCTVPEDTVRDDEADVSTDDAVQEDSIPSEEDMDELFKRIEKKYKNMLRK